MLIFVLVVSVTMFAAYALIARWLRTRGKGNVRENGVSLVAWIVQANDSLFRASGGDAPAHILISFEDRDGESLEAIRDKVIALKNGSPTTPDEQRVARIVRDEDFHPDARYRLPLDFTGGVEVYSAGVWIEKKHLPAGRLDGHELLVRAVPGDSGKVFLDQAV